MRRALEEITPLFVDLSGEPLSTVFENEDTAIAAAQVVLALRKSGDRFGPITVQRVATVCGGDYSEWTRRPLNVNALERDGVATFDAKTQAIEFTPAAILQMRCRSDPGSVCHPNAGVHYALVCLRLGGKEPCACAELDESPFGGPGEGRVFVGFQTWTALADRPKCKGAGSYDCTWQIEPPAETDEEIVF